MRFAIILYNKAHQILELDTQPSFPPDPQGNPIVVIDITDKPEVQEGWDYDEVTGVFTAPIPPPAVRCYVTLEDGFVTDVQRIPADQMPMAVLDDSWLEVPYADSSVIGCLYAAGQFLQPYSVEALHHKMDEVLALLRAGRE